MSWNPDPNNRPPVQFYAEIKKGKKKVTAYWYKVIPSEDDGQHQLWYTDENGVEGTATHDQWRLKRMS